MKKEQKPIPRQAANPKRGTKFIVEETGREVWLERVISSIKYFCYYTEERLASDESDFFQPSQLKVPGVYRSSISNVAKPKTDEQKVTDLSLQVFFGTQILMIPDACENCGAKLNRHLYSKNELKMFVAHILPKKVKGGFPEVAIHPLNRMFLGTKCGCHDKWDHNNGEGRVKMKCYPIALERAKTFISKLIGKQYVKACTYLNISWQ